MKTHFARKLATTTISDFNPNRSRPFYLMNTTFPKIIVLLALSVLLALTASASVTNYCGPLYPPPLGVTFSSSGSGSGYSGGHHLGFSEHRAGQFHHGVLGREDQ